MYDNLKALVAADSDGDGTPDNMIQKAYQALNEAKVSKISQADYEKYERIIMGAVDDPAHRDYFKELDKITNSYKPKGFWNKEIFSFKHPTERSRTSPAESAYQKGKERAIKNAFSSLEQGADITKATTQYHADLRSAYDDAVKTYGVNMPKLRQEKENKGFALAEINGTQYIYQGDDASGNPIFEIPNFFSSMKARQSNQKVKGDK